MRPARELHCWSGLADGLHCAARQIFRVFECTKESDGASFMLMAPSIKCYSGAWLTAFMPIAVVLAAIMLVVAPAALFVYIRRVERQPAASGSWRPFDILTKPYKAEMWWWSFLNQCHSLFIVVLVPFTLSDSMERLTIGIMVQFAICAFKFHKQPFLTMRDNQLDRVISILATAELSLAYACLVVLSSCGELMALCRRFFYINQRTDEWSE